MTPEASALPVRVALPAALKDVGQLSADRAARHHLLVVRGHLPEAEDGEANDD